MQALRQSNIFNGVAGTISKIAVFVDWVTSPQLMRGLHGSANPLTPTRNRAFIVATVQRPHDTDARKHRWSALFRDQQ